MKAVQFKELINAIPDDRDIRIEDSDRYLWEIYGHINLKEDKELGSVAIISLLPF